MKNSNPKISTVLIEKSIQNHPMTEKALEAQALAQGFLPDIRLIPDKDMTLARQLNQGLSEGKNGDSDAYETGKQILVFKKARGHQFRTCPGATTPDGKRIVCCNYHVFNFISGCPYNCSYCYLRSYLNQNVLSMQIDIEEPLKELCRYFQNHPKMLFRVGTGEISDSLALPASDPLNQMLVEFFAQEKNALLELKTKSDRIEHLLNLKPRDRVVLSWSLSPPSISEREEINTAPIQNRLLAAQKALNAGYQLGFHLDPLIYLHSNWSAWEKDYRDLITSLFETISPDQITWLSLGGLRLMKGLREEMMEHYPESKLAYQEFVPGEDGKLRYTKPMRKQMFSFIAQTIQELSGRQVPPVYLCMETRTIWDAIFQGTPDARGDLKPLFNRSFSQPHSL
jgi:spore photoproduct lyase